MKSFTQLTAWKEGMKLVQIVYELTKSFPKEEQFGLTSQLRRSVTSILANLAEGFSRATPADKQYRYIICRSECTESVAHLLIALELHFCEPAKIQECIHQAEIVGRLLSGLIYAQERKTRVP